MSKLPPEADALFSNLIVRARIAAAKRPPGDMISISQLCSLTSHIEWLRDTTKMAIFAVESFENAGKPAE